MGESRRRMYSWRGARKSFETAVIPRIHSCGAASGLSSAAPCSVAARRCCNRRCCKQHSWAHERAHHLGPVWVAVVALLPRAHCTRAHKHIPVIFMGRISIDFFALRNTGAFGPTHTDKVGRKNKRKPPDQRPPSRGGGRQYLGSCPGKPGASLTLGRGLWPHPRVISYSLARPLAASASEHWDIAVDAPSGRVHTARAQTNTLPTFLWAGFSLTFLR